MVSAVGLSPDPAKVQAVRDWRILSSIIDVRNFLGVTGYYKRFIPQFATSCVSNWGVDCCIFGTQLAEIDVLGACYTSTLHKKENKRDVPYELGKKRQQREESQDRRKTHQILSMA